MPELLNCMLIRDLFRIPERYLRSVHLERDFHDAATLKHYIITPPMAEAFGRILDGLRPGSGRRAWRITGDYGSGKSSFALVLAHLLRDPSAPALSHVRRAIDLRGLETGTPKMAPVLVTGAREGIVVAVARGVSSTITQLKGQQKRPPRALAALEDQAAAMAYGDGSTLVDLLSGLTAYAVGAGYSGVLLVLDELGKLLEHAALHPDREDVFVLQRLAEAAARSGEQPLALLGLLHQGFHAYAERLPSAARHEWEKVAGRFEEIVFDQPLAHVSALVAGALNVRMDRMPSELQEIAPQVSAHAVTTGWFGGDLGERQALDPLALYPLHPTVLPVLVRFFARFGQHERSLFSFLLSSEPFGLQGFAERRASVGTWYRLADFYDYVRSVFGYRLAGASHRSQWARLLDIMDGITELDPLDLRLLKTVAVLNIVNTEHLLATNSVLDTAVGGGDIESSIAKLKARGILYDRGAAGGYCLWSTTSVNLDAAFAAAERALGPVEEVAAHLGPYLDLNPLLARRHYIEKGALRYFEVRYAPVDRLREAVAQPTEADGMVVVALCDDTLDHMKASGFTTSPEVAERPEVILAVPRPLGGLAADVHDVRCWQWVIDHTPELAHDDYAAAEARRQLTAARRRLLDHLASFVGFRGGEAANEVTWARSGQPFEVSAERGLLAVLSPICDELYFEAPRIRNELLNRRQLSSAAAAARMRLIERMFTAPDQPELGMDPDKAPPEKSMYLSVLYAGAVHREECGRWVLAEPRRDWDPLNLRPALRRLLTILEEAGDHRVAVTSLMAALRQRPFGVREGVIPLLLAIIATSHGHELAVYENGTFLQRFGPAEFLRLIKLPTAFEFQLCRITGVRAEVFDRLVTVFATERPQGRRAEVLDVVTPLCQFAAQLPEYTRRSTDLPEAVTRVRDALLTAREPATLLFRDLPIACGLDAFSTEEPAAESQARAFVNALRRTMDRLRAAYPELLVRIRARLARALRTEGDALDRPGLAGVATQVALGAREPRLRAFALRLADERLSEDAWTEAIASVILAKPPARWIPGDEARCGDEIDVLGATFQRVQAINFHSRHPTTAVRVGLSQADGTEEARVVQLSPEVEGQIGNLLPQVRALLPASENIRLALLSRLLHEELFGNIGQDCTRREGEDGPLPGVARGAEGPA